MISGVTIQVGGASETFRMTTRAMMAVEDHHGCGIVDVVSRLEKEPSIGGMVGLLAECADNGAGRDIGWVQDAIDQIGMVEAGDLIGRIAAAAFPEAKDAAKKPKRAVRTA